MPAISGLRTFSLSADRLSGRVSFDTNGIFVKDVPLLTRSRTVGRWSVRPIAVLND